MQDFSYISGSPVIVNGDEFENIELRRASDIVPQPRTKHGTPYPTASGRQLDNNDNAKSAEFVELSRNIANLTQV